MRSRFFFSLFGLLPIAALAASCGIVSGLDDLRFEDEITPCLNNATCDDQNPCTVDSCRENGFCFFQVVADGPSPEQTPGDCQAVLCNDGQASFVPDNKDLVQDSNECDVESCEGGKIVHTPEPDGTDCNTGVVPGVCTNGKCDVECGPGLPPCDDGEPCTEDKCDGTFGLCDFAPLGGIDTPGAIDTPGDCHRHVCVNGKDTDKIDNTDVPVTATDCDNEKCTIGVPSNPPRSINASCNTNGGSVCDGMGNCVECNNNFQCSGPTTCGGGGVPNACGCTPKTCADLNRTCGTASDGCGNMLSCDDGMQNGTETDVDCGGGTGNSCSQLCALGKKCTKGSDCTNGFCVDGVCCNSSCTGTCQACSAVKKGGGTDGTCGPIAVDTDPDNECTDQGVMSCGFNGTCNGAGACAKYASGTVCVAGSCMGGVAVPNRTCNGSGTCQTVMSTSCGAYVCGATACLTSCTSDAECAATAYCSLPNCVPKKAAGQPCGGNNECISGSCSANICN